MSPEKWGGLESKRMPGNFISLRISCKNLARALNVYLFVHKNELLTTIINTKPNVEQFWLSLKMDRLKRFPYIPELVRFSWWILGTRILHFL